MTEENKMIIYYVKINEDRTIIDFSNNEQEDYIKVQVYPEWNEMFCIATSSFKLDENNGLVPPADSYSATWKKWNEMMPSIRAIEDKAKELEQENVTLQNALDTSNEKYNSLLSQLQEAEQTGKDLGDLVVALQSQIESLKGDN